MPRAIVVVPCFNEAKRLDLRAIQDFGQRPGGVELLFVNDGSHDQTLDVLTYLHHVNPRRFRYLNLPNNGGKAEAVRQGVLAALESGARYVGYWDADLATPLADIAAFVRVLDERPQTELVIGTRMALLGRAIERRPLRRVLGRAFARTASLALNIRVFDTQCGAKLFRATPELAGLFAQPFLTRWIFDVELLARWKQVRRAAGLPSPAAAMYEVPLDAWRDVAGSTVKGGDFVKAAGEMARIWWTYLRPGAPLPQRGAARPSLPGAAPHGQKAA